MLPPTAKGSLTHETQISAGGRPGVDMTCPGAKLIRISFEEMTYELVELATPGVGQSGVEKLGDHYISRVAHQVDRLLVVSRVRLRRVHHYPPPPRHRRAGAHP